MKTTPKETKAKPQTKTNPKQEKLDFDKPHFNMPLTEVPQVDTTLFHDHLKKTNGKARIKTKSFLDLKALQEHRKEAQHLFDMMDKQLKQDELALITALEAGFEPEPGCPVVIEITKDSEIRPKWKDEAIKLAVQDGLNPEVYVATIRSMTKPTEYKHILIKTPETKK